MNYYHFTNDISFEISLESVTTGQTLDPSVISVVRLFTRKNGRVYCACYGNNTLINNGNTVIVILNNHGLEPGVLQYEVVMQIPDSIYPDKFKKISQFYVSDIELVKGSGQTDYADVQQMFGTTIDEKFDEINNSVNSLSADNEVVKATILNIQEKNNTQDASINAIEEILEGISGDEGAAITRINASVNTLETEVSGIKTDVTDLYSDVERMSNSIENKADVSVLGNYALKTDLNDYPTNSSVSSTYATKAQVQGCIDENDLAEVLADYPTNSSVSDNYTTERYVNENYVSWENLDEAVFNMIDNNYDVHWKINDIVSDSSSFADISTNVKDISTLVTNVSTKLDRDYLTAQTINTDFVKNTSLNTTLAGYVTKTQMNSSLLTKQDSLPFSDESDEIMDNDNLGIAGLAMNSVNGVDEYGILVTDGFEKDEQTGAYLGLENPITGNAAADLIQDYCEDFVQTTDISTFKPIVFCTQEEYDDLVENDQVDANTVYMLSGDQTGGEYLTPNDVSNFVTNSDLQNVLSSYALNEDVNDYFLMKQDLDNEASDLGYLKSIDVSNYLQKNTDIEVSSIKFTDNNTVTTYLDVTEDQNIFSVNIGLPNTDAEGELQDTNILYLHNIYNGDSDQTELTLGQNAKWTKIGSTWNNTNIQSINVSIGSGQGNINILGHDVSIGKTTGNVEILGQNVSIGGRNVNDFITSNDVSVYATTSYVDTQIGNIQNILQTI